MSDSEDPSLPPDTRIETALKDAVARVFRSGDLDSLTIKRMRATVEKELELPTNYLKSDASWNDRSKKIINDEVETQENQEKRSPAPDEDEIVQKKPKETSRAKPKPTAEKAQDKPPVKRGVKRASPAASKPKPQKKRKVVSPEPEEEEESILSSPPKDESEPESDYDAPKVSEAPSKKEPVQATTGHVDDSSELSDVIDEPPPKKRQKSTSTQPTKSSKTSKSSKSTKGAKPKEKDDTDPNQAEIKRLQGWLIKCGIRKMWYKELAPYETPKAKINHLKGMLKDAGMDGRYSVEKAKRIKERREMEADLEAVQEGAKRWGQEGDEESDEEESSAPGKPRRRLAKGFKDLAFLSDDGVETD